MENLSNFLWEGQKGQDPTEYVLLLTLLALGAIMSIGILQEPLAIYLRTLHRALVLQLVRSFISFRNAHLGAGVDAR